MSILAQQLRRPMIKPKWQAPFGVMESVVAYNCRKYGFPIPVLAMPFWEGAGNKAYDVSGKMNHGTLTNGTTWVGGRSGTAVSFDGISMYVSVDDNKQQLASSALTFDMCIKVLPGWVDGNRIVTKKGSLSWNAPSGWSLELNENGLMTFLGSGGEFGNRLSMGWTQNTWYHLLITKEAGATVVKAYLNGVYKDNQICDDITPNTQPLTLAHYPNEGLYLSCIIDQFRIYNVALTDAKIKFLYDNPYFMYEMPEELWGYAVAAGGYSLAVDSGSLALAGTALGLLAARKIPVASGSITLAGTNVGTLKGSKIGADSGSLTLAGQTVNLLADRIIAAASGALSLSGTGVGLLAFRKLLIASGSLALTGTDVNLIYTPAGAYILTASSGALSVAGSAVGLLAARKVPVASGSLTLSGTDVQTLKGSKITVGSGSLTLTGTDVDLLALRKLIATSGVIVLSGTAVTLGYSGGAVPFPLLITISKSGEYTISILKDTEYDISILKSGGL